VSTKGSSARIKQRKTESKINRETRLTAQKKWEGRGGRDFGGARLQNRDTDASEQGVRGKTTEQH